MKFDPGTPHGYGPQERKQFLRQLSTAVPSFVVWKHLDRALSGISDVDALLPRSDWEAVRGELRRIAVGIDGESHVIECDHVDGKLLSFFLIPNGSPYLFEVDLACRLDRLLAPWVEASVLCGVSFVDDGVRRLRPGAEAILTMVHYGISMTGKAHLPEKEMATVLRGLQDREGVEAAICLLPWGGRKAMRRLTSSVQAGGWSARDSAWVYTSFIVGSCSKPSQVLRRGSFRMDLRRGRECLMSDLGRHHRRTVQERSWAEFVEAVRISGHSLDRCADALRHAGNG